MRTVAKNFTPPPASPVKAPRRPGLGSRPEPALPESVSFVTASVQPLQLPTYLPAAPDKNPMFLEKRVYQGSSGKVYPLPFTDRIAETPVPRMWKAVWLENEYLRVLVLPELGGRIHAIQDKTNGYDLIYRQSVIKPALVGLAGPWASGGIEFNWPQHHRPATFLPTDFEIEAHADGSKTVWCSDHDPMCRMKGMHGICLHPGQAVVELKVRAYNRTPYVQTFLWWANVATRVHEAYQSFFPPDVYYVADHARRSMSEYPLAKGVYYGVDYGARGRRGIPPDELPRQYVPPHVGPAHSPHPNLALPAYAPNDLSFYANIPVPTSYMCMGSQEDFFGGYDFKAQAGIVHIANHHLSPGKKQWTWGNHEFGYAWDRNLTEADARGEFAPYIEIMSGVFTDNQPDFSFLHPGETRAWSQYWYPIQKIGPAQQANLQAAISLKIAGRKLRLGVAVTTKIAGARVLLTANRQRLFAATADLAPDKPFITEIALPRGVRETDVRLAVVAAAGREIIAYQPQSRRRRKVPPAATEPPPPAKITSADELFLTGLHLDQYRHATRCPTTYWREALRRDPLDARCNNAMGRWHFKRGEFATAREFFRRALERLTRRNANPYDGEAYYNLGLCLRQLGCDDEAYPAFYKACWNQAWQSAAYHALAEIDCCRREWNQAEEHLSRVLANSAQNHRAANLLGMVWRARGDREQAKATWAAVLARDPLDWWARYWLGQPLACDLQTALDIAHDLARAGFLAEACELLRAAPSTSGDLPDQSWGAAPLVQYTLGWLQQQLGDPDAARASFQAAAALPSDYCFPARLEEIAILEAAMQANPDDAKAPYYLGNLLYDRRRHRDAIRLWERSARRDGSFSIVWRNLGIGYFNCLQAADKARTAYRRACQANPQDARLRFECDQLWKRLGETPERRLRELEQFPALVQARDDLSVELCALYNQTGRPEQALALVRSRKFQPWEGGEGGPLGQWTRSHLALGRAALQHGEAELACDHFAAALTAPPNLGEARHLLANQSDVHYWLGCAQAARGDQRQAREHWRAAAAFRGDFQEMSVRAFSEMTYYSALSGARLGQKARAQQQFRDLLGYAKKLQTAEAKIDYFATSLPTMLLFEDDLQFRQATTALFLQAQAQLGLGRPQAARKLLSAVLQRDPNHALARDLQTDVSGPKGIKDT